MDDEKIKAVAQAFSELSTFNPKLTQQQQLVYFLDVLNRFYDVVWDVGYKKALELLGTDSKTTPPKKN